MTAMDIAKVEALWWEDVVLESFGWISDGRDVELHLRIDVLKGPQVLHHIRRVVRFRWAARVEMKLEAPEGTGGPPMSIGATFTRLADHRSAVLMDFGDMGEIRLECSEIDLEEVLVPFI